MQSTAIKAIGYDPDNQTLGVEFKKGAAYLYFNVPSAVYADFLSACSHGTFHVRHIKKRFRYQKIY